jgi:hypothetical protein
MITEWIDAVQDVWAGISGNGFNSVKAPLLIRRAEFPDAIDAADLALHPLALSIVGDTKFVYSAGGPNEGFYQGVTEFHVAPSLDRSLIPSLLQWPRLIVVAAAAHLQLGGLVNHFALQDRDDQINGPIALKYGEEAEHWGFLVYWEVKENVNSAITVAVGD